MANVDFSIKRGDTGPALRKFLEFSDGTAQDLSGATIRVIYQDADGVAAPVVGTGAKTVIDAAAGEMQYEFVAADTATARLVNYEIEVTTSGGDVITFPNSGFIVVDVVADLA
jgi:hypothetical protein